MDGPAPIKNTVGEGFSVEEQVVASIACHLLSGAPWPSATGGSIVSIDCQTKQDGWFFDDIVVKVECDGVQRACGCSVKSHPVFGSRGAPKNFVAALWNQWRASTSTAFQPDRDWLILIAAQHDPDVREAWFGLTESSRVMDVATFAQRYARGAEPSPLRRGAFESLVSFNADKDPEESVRLLRCLHLLEHDFQHNGSQSATQQIALCQQALADAARNRASELWQSIVTFVAPIRRKGGRIILADLLAHLAPAFPLKGHPYYAPDFASLDAESRRRLQVLPASIGGVLGLDRAPLAKSIETPEHNDRCVVLVGGSGNGKSVLAKNWALKTSGHVLWIRAADLATQGGLRAAFDLKHDIAELLQHSSQPSRMVLDGLDKCFEDHAFDEAARALGAGTAATARDRWQIVITCCPEDWERVRRNLIRRGVFLKVETVPIDYFTSAELNEACKRVPALTGLTQRPHLLPILRWPKALDLVATYGHDTQDVSKWASESDFSRWFWENIICQEAAASFRDRVARKLAVHLGDRTLAAAATDLFDKDELEVLRDLARENHVEIDRDRKLVRFTHELLADWARTRELQVQSANVGPFLQQRLHSPLWHRAVRYHALDLLERNIDAAAWLGLFQQFHSGSTADELAQNLLLEAPIFALNQSATLERLWPLLDAEQGKLLVRFLRQFLRVGTVPDQMILRLLADESPERMLDFAARYRSPWPPYWFGVMAFLGQHVERVTALAPEETADLCLLWLRLFRATKHGMAAAASLAVTAARQFYLSEGRGRSSHHETSPGEKICRALLAAAPVAPEPVTELALKLSGRVAPGPGEALPEEKFARPSFIPDPGEPKPWPEGPVCRPSPAFVAAFMEGQHSAPFFYALPKVGAEVLFAVLLNIPHANSSFDDWSHDIDEHGFNRSSDLPRSSFWTNGPFVAFLQNSPEVALEAIFRLVNFATDRSQELPEHLRERLVVPVTVNGVTRPWRGSQWSFLWHKAHVFGPRAVGCALLSLEQWLYMQLDEKRTVKEHLSKIMEQSRSIALAGVLITVGKKEPDLFLGALRPLVETLDFGWIERGLAGRGEDGYMAAHFDPFGAEREAVQQWVNMPHRKELFSALVVRLFLSKPAWREMIEEMKSRWHARLSSTDNPAPEPFAAAVSQFELSNWKIETGTEQTRIIYTPPSDLPKPTVDELAQMERTQLLLFLPFECRRMLHREIDSPEEKIAEWWSLLETIKNLKVPDDQEGVRNVEDALLGIAAVAIVRHRAWLAAVPARETEARRLLFELGMKPKRFWFTEEDMIDFKWDNFAAWAMTTLWCEQPRDPILREGVAGLSMWERYVVVERVMQIASENRDKLGREFEQLLAHTLRYAPVRDRLQTDRAWDQTTFDHAAAIGKHFEAFLKGKTKPMPAKWKTIAVPKPAGHHRQSAGVDITHMLAALNWAQDLSHARGAAEKNEWLRLYRELLFCALTRIERLIAMPRTKDSDSSQLDQERWPFKDEEQLLRRIGRIVARLSPGEGHRLLWEPIFALGAGGDRWIDTFVGAWFIEAGAHDTVQPAMAEQWKEMLNFGATSPAWSSKSFGWRAGRELWDDLLGIGRLGYSYWDAQLAPVLESVREYHEAWALSHSKSAYDTRRYLSFLTSRAARGLRTASLIMYHQNVPMDDADFWVEDNIQDGFANLLRLSLDENWAELAANQVARDAFMAFALRLTSLQHSLGSDLLTVAGNRFAALPHAS